MKYRTRMRIIHKLTVLVKPCVFFKTIPTPNRDYVNCQFDHSRRKYCKTCDCPHFRPTARYRLARWLGMVR